jgi:hypothetical protein
MNSLRDSRACVIAGVLLPRGTRIVVIATFDAVLLPPGAAPLVQKRPDGSSLRVTLNVVGRT